MGGAYEYVPLLDNEIRLLEILPGGADDRIECRMRTVSLENPPAYGALSYVWGDDKTERLISVDGKMLSVWPNLEAALLEFRREPPTLEPLSHMERFRNMAASFQTMSTDIPFPPPFVNDNWYQIEAIMDSCHDTLSRIMEQARTDIGMGNYKHSEAEKNWAVVNEKFLQLESLGREFTYPKTPSWLVKQPRLLWIDAICINQRDSAERSSQIRIMGEIYLKAFSLVIWLGQEQDGSDLAFEALSNFVKEIPSPPNVLRDMTPFDEWLSQYNLPLDRQIAIKHAIVKLYDRPWFTRGWIRQEYIFGSLRSSHTNPHILVACGTMRARNLIGIAAPLLMHWYSNARLHQDSLESFSSSIVSGFLNAGSLESSRIYFRISRSPGTEPAPKMSRGIVLFKFVAESVFFRTTDPRDKIYSVLGLFQTYFGMGLLDPFPEGLVIDYGASVQVVYSTFMKWVVENTKRLDIFIFWSGPYSKLVQQSWCPDWSTNPHNRFHYGPLAVQMELGNYNYQDNFSFDATPGSSCQANFAEDLRSMTVLGLVWDVVLGSPVQFARPSKLDEDIADCLKWWNFTPEDTQMGCQRFIISVLEETLSEPSLIFYAKLLEALMYKTRFDQEMIPQFKSWCWSAISDHDSPQDKSPAQPEEFAQGVAQDGSGTPRFNAADLADAAPGPILVLTKEHNVARPSYDLVQPGDLICVFPGCPTPMMLRQIEEHFELLGPVYVPGIMQGEAMTALQEKKVELREFELH
jgi:hypothetical protein